MAHPVIFLKLGGSLITEKSAPTRLARRDLIDRLMQAVAEARAQRPQMRLVLAHGAGSFGHVEAKRHGTRAGVSSAQDWMGFLEVQRAVHALHDIVLESAVRAGLPVMSISASSSALCSNGGLVSLAHHQIELALSHNLIPLLHGDVAFDSERGGTVISTEEIFSFLATKLSPSLVLLAGIEEGVLTRWPDGDVIAQLPREGSADEAHVSGSHAADVTGGMRGKVKEAREILHRSSAPTAAVLIFSGETKELVRRAMLGEEVRGTWIGHRRAQV